MVMGTVMSDQPPPPPAGLRQADSPAEVGKDTAGAVLCDQGEFKGQYYIPPPPAKTDAELEAGRKALLEEDVDLDMFGGDGDMICCEDSDEEEPEHNAHLKKDPYDSAASRIEQKSGDAAEEPATAKADEE